MNLNLLIAVQLLDCKHKRFLFRFQGGFHLSNVKETIINFTTEERIILELIGQLSRKHQDIIRNHYLKKKKIKLKKQKLRDKFLKKKKGKKLTKKERIRFQLIPAVLSQALTKGIPLWEPKRKKSSRKELKPLLFEVEDKLRSDEKLLKRSSFANLDLELTFDKIYLQRLDANNSKILVKLFVDWGYLNENKLHLFIDSNKNEIADCQIVVIDKNTKLVDIYPLKHISKLIIDEDESANSLFVGQIDGLLPDEKYKYRIECYRKSDGKLFAGTQFKEFRTSFNLNERNKSLFFSISSDLHGGRHGGFMRGNVKSSKINGNLDLNRVFSSIASTEDKVTFDEGYSLSIATGDLTENASYSEYWADLFKRCSILWDHVPLLTCLGNHDYYCGGKGKGSILGGSEEDCRYWHKYMTNPISYSGSLPGHWYSLDQGNVHAVFLDSNGTGWGKYDIDCTTEQWHWLENDLRNWREKVNRGEKVPQFCFVFLHSAIMSLGFWGRGFNSGNDEKVQSYLTPLFRKYGVDMVFCGHDHIYQRSKWMGTQYLENGRYGGSTRPYFFWKKKRVVYDIERICEDWNTRIYTTVYIPPNTKHLTSDESTNMRNLKQKVREELLSQPLASNYFFGVRSSNQEICRLFDHNVKQKEKLIDELILTKLDDHVWLRAYAVEKNYKPEFQEIIDSTFVKAKDSNEINHMKYELVCPEKVVE